jgi:hypothetical protein
MPLLTSSDVQVILNPAHISAGEQVLHQGETLTLAPKPSSKKNLHIGSRYPTTLSLLPGIHNKLRS